MRPRPGASSWLLPVPVAPQPVLRKRRHWGRAGKRLIKLGLLLLEAPAIVLLAGYAGLFHNLPATPPTARVSGDGRPIAVATARYCWLAPGRAACADDVAAARLPLVTVAQDQTVSFVFGSPPPRACVASVADLGVAGAPMRVIGPLLDTGDRSVWQATERLVAGWAPGIYRLEVNCQWDGPAALHWLQGDGSATYALALRVVPARRPANRTAP